MKRELTFFISVLSTSYAFSQVGVNTDNPMSTLDVSVKMNGSTIDNSQIYGLQAPRLTRAELISTSGTTSKYGANQKGAIVYITDVSGTDTGGSSTQRLNITTAGYYYFDGSVWVKITDSSTPTTSTEPWNESGKTTPATANNQNIYQTGNIGIRSISPATALDITGSTGTTDDDVSIRSIGTGSQAGAIGFERSEGTLTAPTAVATGDNLGSLTFSGNDGSAQNVRARIDGVVNGAVSTGVVPTDLTFTTGANTNATSNASTFAERMRITSAGRVGIGTSTPRQVLEVAGFVRANGFTNSGALLTTTAGVQDFGIFNSTTTSLRIATAVGSKIQFHTDGLSGGVGSGNFSRGGTDPLLTLINNVVGIGVPASRNPSNTLEIVGATTGVSGVRLTNLPSANFLATDSNGDIVNATLPATATTEPWSVGGSTTPATLNNQNIYQSGNVGIGDFTGGTDNRGSLTNAFTIAGTGGANDDMLIESVAGDTSSGQLAFNKSRGTYAAKTAVVAGDNIAQLNFRGNGNSMANIHVLAESATTGYLSMGTSGTERMRITGAGNVGIGTNAPSNKLQITSGTTDASGLTLTNVQNAKFLATDGSGVVVKKQITENGGGYPLSYDESTGNMYYNKLWQYTGQFNLASGNAVSPSSNYPLPNQQDGVYEITIKRTNYCGFTGYGKVRLVGGQLNNTWRVYGLEGSLATNDVVNYQITSGDSSFGSSGPVRMIYFSASVTGCSNGEGADGMNMGIGVGVNNGYIYIYNGSGPAGPATKTYYYNIKQVL